MRILRWILLLTMAAAAALGQGANVYVFVAPGGITCCGSTEAGLHAGVGGEVPVWKRVGAGAEIGALGPTVSIGDGFGVASFNAYGHMLGAGRKLDPFVTGGYSLLWSAGHVNTGNVGGGLNYWFSKHFGLRTEFRDHLRSSSRLVQYWGLRFGITIH